MVTIILRWKTTHDGRACDICKHIDNYEFVFQDEIPESFVHPVYGEIWNTTIGSLAHEHYQYGKKYGLLSNCRCKVEPVDVKAPELVEKLRELRDLLKENLESGENPDYQKGSSRKTTFEDIGIDPSKYGFE